MSVTLQRRDALQKANHVRLARVRLRRQLAQNSHQEASAALAALLVNPPAELASAEIAEVLLWLPGYGQTRVRRLLAQHSVNPLAWINGEPGHGAIAVLTDRQRRILARALTA